MDSVTIRDWVQRSQILPTHLDSFQGTHLGV